MKCCLLRRPLLRAYCSFSRISVLRAFPSYFATSLMKKKENGINYLFVDLDRNYKKISKTLIGMGFTGEVDRIIVALALETRNDRYIITEDSDFGKGDTEKAKEHKDVLDYLTNQLQLTVHDANESLSSL